jgi:CBS domain-containing protein
MKGEMAILESCEIAQEGEKAKADRYTVRLVGGQPLKLVTPEGHEGSVVQISYPLPEVARRNLPFQAAHTLMDKPDVLGFVAVDAGGEVQGVIPAGRLRRLIVKAIESGIEEAQKEVAVELGLDEKRAAEVIGGFESLRTFAYTPGPPGPPIPAVTVYVCPEEGCDTMFIPQQDGVPIPPCPEHKRALVEKKLGG